DAPLGTLAPGSPEDGVFVLLTAKARAQAQAQAQGSAITPGGSIEARVGETIVGGAQLENGSAKVPVTFAAPGQNEAVLRFRYAPDARWLESGNELSLTLPLKGPSPIRHLPLVLAGIAVVLWLVVGRTRGGRAKDKPASQGSAKPAVRGEAKI